MTQESALAQARQEGFMVGNRFTLDTLARPALVRLALGTLLCLLLGITGAQQFAGTYTTMGSAGTVELSLLESGLELSGTLEGNGNSFDLLGEVLQDDPTVAFGTVEAPAGNLVFEAYLEDPYLELYFFTPLPEGGVDLENVTMFEFKRASAASGTTAAADTSARGSDDAAVSQDADTQTANPLAAPPAGNPLAMGTTQDFAGTYSDGSVTLELQPSGAGYGGTLTVAGSSFPIEAEPVGEAVEGVFTAGGGTYQFTLVAEGQGFVLESDGTSYTLTRAGNPLAAPAANDTRAGTPAASDMQSEEAASTQPTDRVLAAGAYGEFTHDAALAFIEALRFSLQQVGEAYILEGVSQQQIVEALAANYSSLPADAQAALANARPIWTQTQAAWAASSPIQQQEFIYAVLAIAYGEQAAANALGLGGNGAGGGNGGGGGDYMGMPSPDPQVQEDTFNAQSCWAGAGCNSYDPSTNDFSFDTYDGY